MTAKFFWCMSASCLHFSVSQLFGQCEMGGGFHQIWAIFNQLFTFFLIFAFFKMAQIWWKRIWEPYKAMLSISAFLIFFKDSLLCRTGSTVSNRYLKNYNPCLINTESDWYKCKWDLLAAIHYQLSLYLCNYVGNYI